MVIENRYLYICIIVSTAFVQATLRLILYQYITTCKFAWVSEICVLTDTGRRRRASDGHTRTTRGNFIFTTRGSVAFDFEAVAVTGLAPSRNEEG